MILKMMVSMKTMTQNTKPTYEELEYQLAVAHAAFKEKKESFEDLEIQHLKVLNRVSELSGELLELLK